MSDEETRPEPQDIPETPVDGSPILSPSERPTAVGGDAALAAIEASAASEPRITDSKAPAAFAATVLGDTLPSAVGEALHEARGGHAHGGGGHGAAHGDEHFAHTLPMTMLIGVLGALVILTVLTVAVTSVDLGSQGNFIVAMIIATIKAALVMGYFMHLVWDSKFNVFAFLSSFLFVLLFLSMALLDRGEYQPTIDSFEADQTTTK
jgi:cytochrome c oxidase subunit IV